MVDEGPFTVARWRPVLAEEHRQALAHAAAIAPAVCRNGSSASTDEIVESLVDGFARAVLHHGGWKPDLGRKRASDVQALRAVFAALAKPDAVVRSGDDRLRRCTRSSCPRHSVATGAGSTASRSFADDVRSRCPTTPSTRGWSSSSSSTTPIPAAGARPTMCGNKRRGRSTWPAASARLDALRDRGHASWRAPTAPLVAGLAQLATEHEPSAVELDIEEAGDFIDQAPFQLEQLGIELLGPEQLVRTKVGVRGTARESPTDDRKGKFGKEALVEWSGGDR